MIHGGNVWEDGNPSQWLDFSAGLRPEGIPDWVRAALLSSVEDARYYPDRAMRRAAEGLARYAGVPADCILPAAGGTAALNLALSRCRGRVLVPACAFAEYRLRASAAGKQIVTVESVREYPTAAQENDLCVLCNPDNPTGAALPREEALSLADALREKKAFLLVDEAFADFCPGVSVRRDLRPNVLTAGSLTKILGMPGVRLGWLSAVPALLEPLRGSALPWQLSCGASAVAERLPMHLSELAEDAEKNAARRERFAAKLRAEGVNVYPSRASFLLADFGRDMGESVRKLKEQGILVRTCESFGLPSSVLRLAVRTDEENERFIRELLEIWNS